MLTSITTKRKTHISASQGLQLDAITTHKWHILPCSAITGANLQEGLRWVVQDAKDRLFLY
jgi:ADP-ribosylation factor-like protein 2